VILAEDEQITWEGEIARLENEEASEDEEVENTKVCSQWMDLPMYSAGGLTQPQTMKLEGAIQGKKGADFD